MLKGIGLVALAQKIEGEKAAKKDFIADTRDLSVVVDSDNTPKLVLANQGEHLITPNAHNQIGGYADIPAKYYDRMLATQPELYAQSVNTWMHAHKPERRMVRTINGRGARAFLSDRYQRIEHEHVAEVVLPILAELPKVQIVSAEVTERRLYIQAVIPTLEGEVKRGDVVQAGVVISNSEIGHGAVSISGLLWRLICLNGMKTMDAFRRAHIGRRAEGDEIAWSEETMIADDKTVLLKVRDTVKQLVDETRFRANLAKLTDLSGVKVSGDPARAVELLSNTVGANENEKGGILRALIEGGDLSAWGMINAVTAQAHNAQSYDRAVEFEEAGGKLLELGRNQWSEILQAA